MLDGGPLDGQEVEVDDGDELVVTMLDRTVHGYARTTGSRVLTSGECGAVFRWSGRW